MLAAGAAGAAVVVELDVEFEALADPVSALPVDVAAGAASPAALPTAASLVLLVPPALLRKSVTYQPEPLS